MKPAKKSHADNCKSRNIHPFRQFLWTISVSYLLLDVHAGLPSAPSCELLHHTTISFRSPRTPPSTTTTALTLHVIFSFQSDPLLCTSFHFITLSYLKINVSPARFPPFFLIPACSFHNFSLSKLLPPPPRFSTPPSDSPCPPPWMLPPTESSGGTSYSSEGALSVDGSRDWDGSRDSSPRVQSRGSVPLQDEAELNSPPLTPEVSRPWNKESVQNKSLCRHDRYGEGWVRREAAGCLEVLSVEGQNGDMMMRREGKGAGGEGGGCFSDTNWLFWLFFSSNWPWISEYTKTSDFNVVIKWSVP